MIPVVAIVDYGLCNLGSVRRAVEICGAQALLLKTPESLDDASHIILPGVGSFARAMSNLKLSGFDQALREQAPKGKPFLGICLGMQLLATTSEEGGPAEGLDMIPGEVKRLIPRSPHERIPHIGWNSVSWNGVDVARGDQRLVQSISSGTNFYFVHSYHFVPADERWVLGASAYCGTFAAVVQRENVYGVQFHPEKSQRMGFQLLRNFLAQ